MRDLDSHVTNFFAARNDPAGTLLWYGEERGMGERHATFRDAFETAAREVSVGVDEEENTFLAGTMYWSIGAQDC